MGREGQARQALVDRTPRCGRPGPALAQRPGCTDTEQAGTTANQQLDIAARQGAGDGGRDPTGALSTSILRITSGSQHFPAFCRPFSANCTLSTLPVTKLSSAVIRPPSKKLGLLQYAAVHHVCWVAHLLQGLASQYVAVHCPLLVNSVPMSPSAVCLMGRFLCEREVSSTTPTFSHWPLAQKDGRGNRQFVSCPRVTEATN